MISYRSSRETVVPASLEKRLEIVAAIRALATQDNEQLRQRQLDISALRRDCELLRRSLAGLVQEAIAQARRECDPRLRSYVIKYSSDQPRVSSSDWQSKSSTAEAGLAKASPDDPQHPGWPAGTPDGLGGKFRLKDSESAATPDQPRPENDDRSVTGPGNAEHSPTNANVAPYTCGQALMHCRRISPGNEACTSAYNACMSTGLPTIFPGGILGQQGGA